MEDADKDVLEGVATMAADATFVVEVADVVADVAADVVLIAVSHGQETKDGMPTYGVGSSLVLVVKGTDVDVEIVSTRVEEGVVVIIGRVVSPNPSLDRKCQFHTAGGVRSRTTRNTLKKKNRTKNSVPTDRVLGLVKRIVLVGQAHRRKR